MVNDGLKRLIQDKYRTQKIFAKVANEYESFVSNIINGQRRLSKEKRKKWRKLLGCRAYLLKPER